MERRPERAPGRRARGFTLIELLVVIAVIGVLIALLLPAVQSAREAARRAQCANNLKQIGLALHNYHDAVGVFPAGYLFLPGGDAIHGPPDPITGDTGPGWAYAMQILPYMEQSTLYDAFNVELPCWWAENVTAAVAQVSTYFCPSATNDGPELVEVFDESENELARLGRSHYVANAGILNLWDVPQPNHRRLATGPFYRNSRIKIADVKDGLSNSIFLGEHSPIISDKTWVGVVPGGINCPDPRWAFSEGSVCDLAATFLLAHSGPSPNEQPPVIHIPNAPFGHVDQMLSEHPGGTHILLGDGGVRFVKETIDANTWVALSTVNRGEIISGEAF